MFTIIRDESLAEQLSEPELYTSALSDLPLANVSVCSAELPRWYLAFAFHYDYFLSHWQVYFISEN